jgi:thiamine biosynthesis lipoprotein
MTADSHPPAEFTHQAMATEFRLSLCGADGRYAQQSAVAAFEELDLLEERLSRFVESSDIARIRRLRLAESTVVSLEVFRCLQLALDIGESTGGAFDVAYATAPCSKEQPCIELIPEGCRVRALRDCPPLDLGGIGKGFALDRLAVLLDEWEIPSALLEASTSTVLATAPPPGQSGWPVVFGPVCDRRTIHISRMAVSASGTQVKGSHIVDPRSGRPAKQAVRAWAVAPTAAAADALSTAWLVMAIEEIRDYCAARNDVAACLLVADDKPLLQFGEMELGVASRQ